MKAVIKRTIKRFIWRDWQDTLIFWVCAPCAVIGLYMLAASMDSSVLK